MSIRSIQAVLLGSALLWGNAYATQPNSPAGETELGLYVTAAEAHGKLQSEERAVLVDVRAPQELMFTGYASLTDFHVPLMDVDTSRFNEQSQTYAMARNPAFLDTLTAQLEQSGVNKDDPVIVMCRSGARAAMAVNLLAEAGYTNAWSVVDGFEGHTETVNEAIQHSGGWRTIGLPWSYELDPDVVSLTTN